MHIGAFDNILFLMKSSFRNIDLHKKIFIFQETEDDEVFYKILVAKNII